MPVRINQPLAPEMSLNDAVTTMFGKYFSNPAPETIAEVMQDVQEQTLSQLDDEIHNNSLIRLVSDSDGTHLDTDNLIEWINLYYTIEAK